MNFEEWYNSYKITGLDKRSAEQVWNACKYECIKLVQQPIEDENLVSHTVKTAFSLFLMNKLEKEI
jgi:hypothetical protein